MASIPHTVFTHFSSFIPFYTYAVPNASRHRNDNTNNCSTHKIPLLPKEKHPNEQKLKLDHQNQNLLNVDFAALCEEGNLDQVLELKGQGVVADYRVYLALLNLCEHEVTRIGEKGPWNYEKIDLLWGH